MSGRRPSNQELRTRKDLLLAAARLMKQGRRKPTMDEVAAEAMVSRATAYRYFRTIENLLVEAPLDAAVRMPEDVFADFRSDDPAERIDQAEASLHEVCYQNEAQLRIVFAHSVGRDPDDDSLPRRQNRRMPLIEAALAPARKRFRKADYDRLCLALAMIFGTESLIVFQDVLRVDKKTARRVKSWAVRALVSAALESSGKSPGAK